MKDDFFQLNERSVLGRDWDGLRTGDHIRRLPIWGGPIDLQQMFGGLQNRTYFVTDADGKRYVARCGFDQFRTRQTSVVACTIAAHRLGVGPALRYAEPNLTITDFVPGPQIQLSQQGDPAVLALIVKAMKILHGGAEALPGSVSYWWVFHTVRRYLNEMESGLAATQFRPSAWAAEVPFFRDVTQRLERAIGPFKPVLTHNDLGFANMMFSSPAQDAIWFIDWDGGGYGNPMWDVAEMAMWANGGEELDRYILTTYGGNIGEIRMKELLHEHVAMKIMAAMRLITECMVAVMDPYFYLTPAEMAESMRVNFAGQQADLAGLVDLVRPMFTRLWETHGHEYT
jgi:Phosphotransferase enzyme family